MIEFLLSCYTFKKNVNFWKKMKVYGLRRKMARALAKKWLPKMKPSKVSLPENNNPKIIITLTSFPKRIGTTWMAIESILCGHVLPDKIILYLSKEQFPNGQRDLPVNLIELESRGLDIRFVDGDIRAHKKYYYVIQEYPEASFVTIDDDLIYSSHFLEDLLKAHEAHPKAVLCNYIRQIKQDNTGNLLSYNTWPITTNPGNKPFFFGTGGGTLFPPHSLFIDVTNKDLFWRITPLSDDIWLNFMVRLNHTELRFVEAYRELFPVTIEDDISLSASNVVEGKNDTQIQAMIDHYGNVFHD